MSPTFRDVGVNARLILKLRRLTKMFSHKLNIEGAKARKHVVKHNLSIGTTSIAVSNHVRRVAKPIN